jgi:hypothetical protein
MALAVSRHTLPVYEIFKVGEELHWLDGLDLFSELGLELSIVPHWNNNEGGTELDTSHCYMGQRRFDELCSQLPPDPRMLAIDEHTACVMDLEENSASVHGAGTVTVIRGSNRTIYDAGASFSIDELR